MEYISNQNSWKLILTISTGNLDSKNADVVFDILDNLKQAGKTIVMVTHERDIMKGASRKIVIKDGEVQEDYPLKGDY